MLRSGIRLAGATGEKRKFVHHHGHPHVRRAWEFLHQPLYQ